MFICKELYGLPGGDQVDGLPPAAMELGSKTCESQANTNDLTRRASFLRMLDANRVMTVEHHTVLSKVIRIGRPCPNYPLVIILANFLSFAIFNA